MAELREFVGGILDGEEIECWPRAVTTEYRLARHAVVHLWATFDYRIYPVIIEHLYRLAADGRMHWAGHV